MLVIIFSCIHLESVDECVTPCEIKIYFWVLVHLIAMKK